jgi:C-terminal processing protease CtpA/Prc
MKGKLDKTLLKPALIAGLSLAMAGAVQPPGQAAQDEKAANDLRRAESGVNRALSLNGESASVQVADAPALRRFTNTITLEAWVRAYSFYANPGSINSIIRKNVQAGAENFFLRYRNTDGPRLVEVGLGSQLGVIQAPFDVSTNQWYHLAGTYDGGTLAVYVNGIRIRSEPVSGDLTIDASDLVIGKGDPEFSFGEFFHGVLDEIRVWNVARSPTEIQAAINAPLTGKENGLVAYWNFDDNTANDMSGHGNNGRLLGKAQIIETPRPVLSPAQAQATATAEVETAGLTPEKGLEILETLWRNLSEIYPALEYKGIRGREWIEPAVKQAREAKTDQEFYEILLQQMASLKDTHTRIISYPGQPRLEMPPVLLNQVDGKVAVIRAAPETSLSPGDIIVSVETRPADECLQDQMKRVCNSTDRGRVREACGQLLRGAPGTTVNVGVQGADNVVRQVALRRVASPDFWREPAISQRRLGDSIGCIRISRWTDNRIPEQFDQALETFKDTRGLVIDVRSNGGGNDQLADLVNGRLTAKPVVSSIDFWRKTGTDQYQRTIGWVQPRGPWTYKGRVAVLIDEASMSACEHFVSGIEAMDWVLLVGAPTNGAGGGPTSVKLPDGTRVAISRALGFRANGVVFEGHGIPPHIYSIPTLYDLRQGRDAALELAKAWILSDRGVPARSQPL